MRVSFVCERSSRHSPHRLFFNGQDYKKKHRDAVRQLKRDRYRDDETWTRVGGFHLNNVSTPVTGRGR